MSRRKMTVFSLSFLDAMTCGFGAVVLFFMVINASVGLRAGQLTADLQGEVNKLEREVLDGHEQLVELRNSVQEVEERAVTTQGLARRLIQRLLEIREELATYEKDTLADVEHVNRLKTDLATLEDDVKRLSASAPSDETPGDSVRAFVGEGDRQYLTGLKVGGERIFILVDASASMLDDEIVNIVRRRNLPDEVKLKAAKWQQAVDTVDWITTQIPRESYFQIYTFNETAGSVVPETDGQWLETRDVEVLNDAVLRLRRTAPSKGTSLIQGFMAIEKMHPRPDNLILLVDGLPTMGGSPPTKRTVTGKQRVKHYNQAVKRLSSEYPINVILFPMEGDPLAASAYWKLAIATGGSFMTPAEDWP